MDDELRTYLINGDALPARLASELSLQELWNWSLSQQWAWDELQRQLRACVDMGQPPTGMLASWAALVATGQMKPPRHKAHDDRDWRVLEVVNVLMRRGYRPRPRW